MKVGVVAFESEITTIIDDDHDVYFPKFNYFNIHRDDDLLQLIDSIKGLSWLVLYFILSN